METKKTTKERKQIRKVKNELSYEFGGILNDDFIDEEAMIDALIEDEL